MTANNKCPKCGKKEYYENANPLLDNEFDDLFCSKQCALDSGLSEEEADLDEVQVHVDRNETSI